MMREQLNLTEEDGYAALRGHVAERAALARARHGPALPDVLRGHGGERHGPVFDEDALRALLADPEVMRFPTTLAFDAAPLLPGEFAFPRPNGERPSAGYTLCVHPQFEGRWDVLPLLVAYHVVAVNYLDIATNEEAELFGATLLGLAPDEYYARLCELADTLPEAALAAAEHAVASEALAEMAAAAEPKAASGTCGSCSCGGGC